MTSLPGQGSRQAALRRSLARLRRRAGRLVDHLAPRSCALCSVRLGPGTPIGLCMGCLLALPGGNLARCARCALPSRQGSPCSCLKADWPILRTVAAADYAPPLDRLIGALKFGRQLPLARPLGELIGLAWSGQQDPPDVDVLVPVPLGAGRLAQRGFNQSLEIARSLAHSQTGRWPVLPRTLIRQRDTSEQSALARTQRLDNLHDAFAVRGSMGACRVGLVDDVMTTGATAVAAARALHAAGALSVVVLVAARTVP